MVIYWLLLLVIVELASLGQSGSSLLCDNERGVIKTSSGTVLVDTSLQVDPVCIRCGYQDQLYTDPAIVTYYYNGAVIVNDTVGGVSVTDEGLIIQDPASYFDNGDHINCTFLPRNTMAKFNIINFTLFVSAKVLSFTPHNTTVVVGNTLTLNCSFEGDPLPSVLWSHNSTILNVLTNPNLSETLSETYALLDVTFTDINDTGMYICAVNNSFSFDQSNPNVFIVWVYPSAATTFQADLMTKECISLSWTSGFNGNAPIVGVDISYKATENYFLPHSSSISTANASQTSIVICDLEPLTTYDFTLIVRNEANGRIGLSVPLTLPTQTSSSEPYPPILEFVLVESFEALSVEWTVTIDSFTQASISGFEIHYKRLNNLSVMTVKIMNGLARSHIIHGLEVNTVYEIAVASINSAGYSPESNTLQQRTRNFVSLVSMAVNGSDGYSCRTSYTRTPSPSLDYVHSNDLESQRIQISVIYLLVDLGVSVIIIMIVISVIWAIARKQSKSVFKKNLPNAKASLDSLRYHSKQLKTQQLKNRQMFCHPKSSLLFEEFCFDREGFFHHSSDYGVTIVIPKNAVKEVSTLQFGVASLITDFSCDDSLEPVSPFVWVHTDTELTKPAQLYIPHHVLLENDEDRKNLCLLTRGDEQTMFKVNKDLCLKINETFAEISGKHFCSTCIATKRELKKRYQIVLAKKRLKGGVHKCAVCILYCMQDLETFKKQHEGYEFSKLCRLSASFETVKLVVDLQLDDPDWRVSEIPLYYDYITEDQLDMFKYLKITPRDVSRDDIDALSEEEKNGSYPYSWKNEFSPKHHPSKTKELQICLICSSSGRPDQRVPCFKMKLEDEEESQYSLVTRSESDSTQTHQTERNIVTTPSLGLLHKQDGEIIRFLDTRLPDYLTFGYALGVDVNKLVQMKSMNSPLSGDTKGCIENIFHQWKTNSNNASYQPILDALKASGYGYFSDIIEKYYEFPRQVNLSTFELTNEESILNSPALKQRPDLVKFSDLVIIKIPAKWGLFGIQLGFNKHDIDCIEKDCSSGADHCQWCFISIFTKWENRGSRNIREFTWRTVVMILSGQFLSEPKVAYEVFKLLVSGV